MKILKGAEVSAKIKEEVAQIAAGLQEVPKHGDHPCGRESG